MEVLETKRLKLRHFEYEDAPEMYRNWASDEEVARYLSWSPHPSLKVSEKLVADWIAAYNDPDFYQWAIVEKSSGTLIGSISVVHSIEKEKTIGYVLGRAWWNQGYMTEALKAVIRYLFEETKTEKINAYHALENIASGRVMLKANMEYRGITSRLVDHQIQQFAYYEIEKKTEKDLLR